jgi:signal transduction histidine kinase
MKNMRNPTRLRLLFIVAVILPCLVLGVIAIRSINREEAFIAIRLQRTLEAELVYTVSVLNSELDRILDELATSAPTQASASPEVSFTAWKSQSELVRVPFLLAPSLEIVWPTLGGALSEDDRMFLNWNREFVTDKVPVPSYQNIALFFKDEISKLQEPPSGKTEAAAEEEEKAEPPSGVQLNERLGIPTAAKPAGADSRSRLKEAQVEQRALSQFERDPGIREQVFDQARALGRQTEQRNVAPSADSGRKQQSAPEESIFISEPLRFSEITAQAERGIIPRFIEEKLTLLFWERDSAGGYVGCVLDDDAVRSRLAKLLPNVHTPARILTILDENGRPLLTGESGEQRDWRRPFAAREISAKLPRWEVAAYLTDPNSIASQAGTTTRILWILVLFLFAAIAAGGVYILQTLRSEMQLARQKTTFVANVSHELKTPLTSIRMFAEMLKQGRQPDMSKQQKYLDLMVSETERLTRLINNVLDFARVERGQRKYEKRRLDVAWLCEGLIEGQRVRLEHNGFTVTFRNDLGEAFIEGDEEALKQAVLNLLSNAEKYSGEDKRVDVEVSGTEGSVLINVKDRGRGIPPGEAKRIFEEFYRVDDSLTTKAGGSGLGLPIALRIVRDHGGGIHYFPRDGGGSIFQIRLPLGGQP